MNQNPKKFNLYGDESTNEQSVIYGIVGIPTSVVERVRQVIEVVKEQYGGAKNSRLHCRVLFHTLAREKSEWAHLDETNTKQLFLDLIEQITKFDIQSSYGHLEKNRCPEKLKGPPIVKEIPLEDKQLIVHAYQIALIPFLESPGVDNFKLWADPDTTKVEWAGKRRKAQNLKKIGLDGGLIRGGFDSVTPEVIEAEHLSLLELADLLSYSCLQMTKSKDSKHLDFFREMVSSFNPKNFKFSWEQSQFFV